MNFQTYDPYDPASNPLGSVGLRSGYLDAANALVGGEMYADLLLEQEPLDTSSLSADLAVQVAALQGAVRACARVYLQTVVPDLVGLFSDAGNLAGLFSATRVSGVDFARCDGDPKARADAVDVLTAISDQAGEIGLGVSTSKMHLAVLQKNLAASSTKLDTALASAVAALGADAVAAGKEIDRLNAAVAKNIAAIVEGGNEAGAAVADLGIGILTQFSKAGGSPDKPAPDKPAPDKPAPDKPAPDKPAGDKPTGDKPTGDKPTGDKPTGDKADGDKPAGDKPAGDKPTGDKPTGAKPPAAAAAAATTPKAGDAPKAGETPNVDFVLKAIKAASAGVAKYSTAIAEIALDNQSLAAAYQDLARLDVLVAVAKASQAQKDLFRDAVSETVGAVDALGTQWAAVRKNLTAVSAAVETLDTVPQAAALARLAKGGEAIWTGLATEMGAVKRMLTGAAAPLTV